MFEQTQCFPKKIFFLSQFISLNFLRRTVFLFRDPPLYLNRNKRCKTVFLKRIQIYYIFD